MEKRDLADIGGRRHPLFIASADHQLQRAGGVQHGSSLAWRASPERSATQERTCGLAVLSELEEGDGLRSVAHAEGKRRLQKEGVVRA